MKQFLIDFAVAGLIFAAGGGCLALAMSGFVLLLTMLHENGVHPVANITLATGVSFGLIFGLWFAIDQVRDRRAKS